MYPSIVLEVLERTRILYTSELELQDAVEEALRGAGLNVRREVPLDGRSRIDFVVEDVGIECKVDGAWRAVGRQLERYAQSGEISSIILVTTRNRHSLVPTEISGKPIIVHRIGSVL